MRFDRRVALAGIGVLAVAATGAVWSGCGDDTQDQVNQAIDNAQQQAEDIQSTVQEQVQQATDDAGQAANDVQDQVDQATEDAQNAIDEATSDSN